jgi:chromosome segregation ATPase
VRSRLFGGTLYLEPDGTHAELEVSIKSKEDQFTQRDAELARAQAKLASLHAMLDNADSNLAALYARQAAAAVTSNVVKQSLAQQQMTADTKMHDLMNGAQDVQAALKKATLQLEERQVALCVPVYDVHACGHSRAAKHRESAILQRASTTAQSL